MEEYQGYAYAVAIRVVCDEEDAKDIVQEAFIRVWKNFSRYDGSVKFTTWLYSIIGNLCVDTLRSRQRKPAVSAEDARLQLLASTAAQDDPERLCETNELAALIERASHGLPPKQKLIFVLRDVQGLGIREVCDILHLSEGSVKTNLVYARRYIREHIDHDPVRRQ